MRLGEMLLLRRGLVKGSRHGARSRDLWDSRWTGWDGFCHRPMRTTVMAETKGPPDTKYGWTVCRRAVSESLHRRFVYPTSPGEEEDRNGE